MLVAFRSPVIAVKAIVLNLLSVAAAYGVLVLVFQHGYGSGLLGFTPTGGIDPVVPLLLFVILFGLSMDYHVFLLSRIREAVQRGATTDEAVAQGHQVDRRRRHERRDRHGRRLRGLRDALDADVQAVRRRARDGDPARRDDRPRRAAARVDEAARRLELVPAAVAPSGCPGSSWASPTSTSRLPRGGGGGAGGGSFRSAWCSSRCCPWPRCPRSASPPGRETSTSDPPTRRSSNAPTSTGSATSRSISATSSYRRARRASRSSSPSDTCSSRSRKVPRSTSMPTRPPARSTSSTRRATAPTSTIGSCTGLGVGRTGPRARGRCRLRPPGGRAAMSRATLSVGARRARAARARVAPVRDVSLGSKAVEPPAPPPSASAGRSSTTSAVPDSAAGRRPGAAPTRPRRRRTGATAGGLPGRRRRAEADSRTASIACRVAAEEGRAAEAAERLLEAALRRPGADVLLARHDPERARRESRVRGGGRSRSTLAARAVAVGRRDERRVDLEAHRAAAAAARQRQSTVIAPPPDRSRRLSDSSTLSPRS